MSFCSVYIPVGVPTYHLETAQDQFERSCAMLRGVDPDFVCPDEMLLTLDKLRAYLDGLNPDLIVFQNLTFANAAYMAEVLRRYQCPMLLWTLREPVIDGGRLRLNSLTGAYSAANTLAAFDGRAFNWCFGAPEEESVVSAVKATVEAAKVKKAMRSLTMSAIGHTPQGFGFGRALDSELMNTFAWTRPRSTIGMIMPVCSRLIAIMSGRITSAPWLPAAGPTSSPPSARRSAPCSAC